MTGEDFGRDLADLYQADEESIADILSYIKEIEEISFI
jgi:hypothetical protein